MKKSLYLTAAAAIALTSCSQDDLFNGIFGSNDNAIAFDSYLGKSAQTRATVVDKESLKTEGFGVNAYYNEGTDKEVFMKNTKVTFNGEDEKGNWVYSPVKYWPNNDGDELSFYAYGPYNNKNITVNETDFTKLGFTVNNKVLDQVDFIYNDQVENPTLNLTNPTVNDKVSFKFQHALSRIGFTVQVVVDETDIEKSYKLDGNTHINVKEVEIIGNNDASFYESGTLDMSATGTWKDVTGSQNFTFTGDNFYRTVKVEGEEVVQLHKFNQKQSLLNEKSYLMIIPQDFTTDGFNIKITYDVITEGENGDNSTITNEITSETPLQVNFEQGKAYNFNLILGMTSVKFDVDEVVAWEDATTPDTWLPENEGADPVWDEETQTFLIYNAAQLATMRDKINNGESYTAVTKAEGNMYSDATYKQMADIDLSGYSNWTPIANDENKPFTGKYDGNNKVITGLTLNNQTTNFAGLFGFVESNNDNDYEALIENINIVGCSITGKSTGAIAGQLVNSTVKNCTTSGTGDDVDSCGGIVSIIRSGAMIINCTNNISFINACSTGGICSGGNGRIIACVNKAEIGGDYPFLGGIASQSFCDIIACYNTGNISNAGNCAGGIAADASSVLTKIIASYSNGIVQKTDNSGSFVGTIISDTYINNCFYYNANTDVPAVGSGTTNNVVCVSDDDWSTAKDKMNQALAKLYNEASEADKELYNWKYVAGSGSAPLVLETGCVEYVPALEGKGSEADPYLISSLADLELMRDNVNNKVDGYVDAHYKQTANIDMSTKYSAELGNSWTPIGNSQYFKGHYDGNGKEIQNIYINTPKTDVGLFGIVEDGTIENVTISSGSITSTFENSHGMNGSIVGYLYTDAKLINCKNNASIKADGAGGIAGACGGGSTIIACVNTGTIEGGASGVGGIVGYCTSTVNIYASSNTGMISANSSITRLGGILGDSYSGGIISCYNDGKVYIRNYSSNNTYQMGGILGLCRSESSIMQITNCYFGKSSDVTQAYYSGGTGTCTLTDTPNEQTETWSEEIINKMNASLKDANIEWHYEADSEGGSPVIVKGKAE